MPILKFKEEQIVYFVDRGLFTNMHFVDSDLFRELGIPIKAKIREGEITRHWDAMKDGALTFHGEYMVLWYDFGDRNTRKEGLAQYTSVPSRFVAPKTKQGYKDMEVALKEFYEDTINKLEKESRRLKRLAAKI